MRMRKKGQGCQKVQTGLSALVGQVKATSVFDSLQDGP